MSRTQILALSGFILLVVLANIFDSWNNQEAHMKGYVKEIEQYLRPIEKQVRQVINEKESLYTDIFQSENQSTEKKDSTLEKLEALSDEVFGIYFFEGDSLIFWSKSNVLPEKSTLTQLKEKTRNSKLVKLPNGYYEYLESIFQSNPNLRTVALIPVKNQFRLESSYLENWFLASDYIPWQVSISEEKTENAVAGADGQSLFYLSASDSFKDAPQQKVVLFLYILAALCLAIFINSLSRQIVYKYQPGWGAAFLIGSVLFVRLLSLKLDFAEKFDNLAIFATTFQTPVLNYTLGDLLIDILLLLWLMVFFHREFKVKRMLHIAPIWQYLLTTLNYFSILLGILMITSVFKSLVLDSGITFDFDNIFQLSVYSVLAIFGVIFLLFALFLFSHRMMLTIQNTGLPSKKRLIAQLAAVLLLLPVIFLTDLDLPFLRLAIGAALFILLFDIYIEIKDPSITWLGIWLVFFSGFSAVLLFKYNEDKDLNRRISYSQQLSEWNDTTAVKELGQFQLALDNNPNIEKLLFNDTLSELALQEGLTEEINNIYSDFKYLFNIYTFDFDVKKSSNPSPTDIGQKYQRAKTSEIPNVKYWTSPKESYSYLISENYVTPNEEERATLFIKAHKRIRKASRVYSELILTQHFKDLKDLDLYDYAIYKNDSLVEASSGIYEETPLKYLELLDPREKIPEISTDGRSELVYSGKNNVVVVIGRPMRDLLKPISLFSYLFVLLALTVVFLAFLNTVSRLLPEVLQLTVWRKPSLKNKIQLAVIMTIVGSFVMIGWVTVMYFRQTSEEYHENRLMRKLGSVLMDAEHEIQLQMETGNKNVDLEKLVNDVSPIHRVDINVYDRQGALITSTEMDIFNKGIVAPKMGGVAFHSLVRQGNNENIQSERIGDLSYKAAYVPLHQPSGSVIGYIGLPYYAKQRNLKDDVYEFMGTLLNVYVFLLLIAATIAIFVANSITRPISAIGDQFRRFKMGSSQHLTWTSNDELGDLIKEYNMMLDKVAASTEIIKKSEREGAWRDMAQQVAHEIKNPLTPMKLSIQYLQHAVKTDPENAMERFDRVAKTLTEQIESLVGIATAFSNFAKMPKPINKPMIINELVDSVYDLNVKNQEVDFTMSMPDEDLTTVADKNQLRRVMNNIMSNAIQAIPDDRRGKIGISLYEKDNKAIIKISDNGKGISEEMQQQVFQPHFTTRSSGMGLGLAMCKDIIELAGGTINFKTVIGKGTDFFIELPKVAVKMEDLAAAKAAEKIEKETFLQRE